MRAGPLEPMRLRTDYERVHDEQREYLAHVLSRTKRKDYENYVVNAVWQRLGDPYLQPETQRYVRRDNGYALIDLYFPAVNVGVECDEAYHLGDVQRMSDKAREEEISARFNSVDGARGYLTCHVRAFGTFEQMEHDIDQAVKAINRRKRELRPEPWMPGRPPWEVAIERGSIRVGDGLAFRTISDVYRCFGHDTKRMQRCYFSLHHGRYCGLAQGLPTPRLPAPRRLPGQGGAPCRKRWCRAAGMPAGQTVRSSWIRCRGRNKFSAKWRG